MKPIISINNSIVNKKNIFKEGNLVQSIFTDTTIMLITKDSPLENNAFEGVNISGTISLNIYRKDWNKKNFKQFEGEITLKI